MTVKCSCCIFLLVCSWFSSAGLSNAEQKDYWYIPAASYKCILEKSRSFLEEASDPILIFVDDCSIGNVDEYFADSTTDSLVSINKNETSSYDKVIVYDKDHLRCLLEKAVPVADAMVKIKKNPCE